MVRGTSRGGKNRAREKKRWCSTGKGQRGKENVRGFEDRRLKGGEVSKESGVGKGNVRGLEGWRLKRGEVSKGIGVEYRG